VEEEVETRSLEKHCRPGAVSLGTCRFLPRTWRLPIIAGALFQSLSLVSGCAGVPVIPPELHERVDRRVSFEQVKASPASYQGRIIVVGGVVLSVRWLKEGTRIEVLHLPLGGDLEPIGLLTDSRGRFLALKTQDLLDPATVPIGTWITVVGEVSGSTTQPLDEIEYVYPILDIKSLTVWPLKSPAYWVRPYPYFGSYWGPYRGLGVGTNRARPMRMGVGVRLRKSDRKRGRTSCSSILASP
jgi:outer membrane lipoprotein